MPLPSPRVCHSAPDLTTPAGTQVDLAKSYSQHLESSPAVRLEVASMSLDLPNFSFSPRGCKKNEIDGLKQWPKAAFLQVHSGSSPIVLAEPVTAAYEPMFFTVSRAHL